MAKTRFEKSGRRSDVCYPDFAKEAVTKALSDVKIPYTEVQQAAVGGAAVVRLYRLGFPASVNIKSNLISAASATIEGFKVTPLLKLLEQPMMKDQENLIEKKFEVEISGRNRRTRGGAVPDRTRKSGRSYERTFAQRQCELIIDSDS
ncbi:hypothetical protein GQX74_005742 [Glossina fuscipes]|nr:hypothetical protein GQX74_005742 [Glossina fuscipes]